MNGSILIIEDDERLANLIVSYLSKHQYDVAWYPRGDSAEQEIARLNPDIIILDVMLPGKSGFDICRDIQAWYTGYVLIMTASEDNLDEIIGLELGADDYLAKPVEPRLLLARIRALLRRRQTDNGLNHKQANESMDARISRLRRKLSGDDESNSQQYIKTIRGKGYLFNYDEGYVV